MFRVKNPNGGRDDDDDQPAAAAGAAGEENALNGKAALRGSSGKGQAEGENRPVEEGVEDMQEAAAHRS